MPKIPQYNRQQFASSYVGAPQADRSGEIIAEGVSQMATPIIKDQASAMRARELARIDQQVDRALLSHNYTFQQKIKQLEQEYADNPKGFADAVLEAGFPVVERHAHHYAPNYISPGRDAAVAYPNIDLKWRNDLNVPVKLVSFENGQRSVLYESHRGHQKYTCVFLAGTK